MTAVRYHRYGGPEVLTSVRRPEPEPAAGDVLVAVRGASASGGELPIIAGKLRRIVRNRPPQGVGNDFAGVVVATGRDVDGLGVGEAVWGVTAHGTFGSVAELVAVPAAKVSPAPESCDLLSAAALPAVGTTVLEALEQRAQLRAGERLLVRGAAGGVGSVAVQLGRSIGAHVTALASRRDLEWVRSIGADVSADYRTTALRDLEPFDVILDVVGTELRALRGRLTPDGRLVALGLDADHLVRSFVSLGTNLLVAPRAIKAFSNDPTAERLGELAARVDAGAIRPIVHASFGIDDARAAYGLLADGGVRGKIVVAVAADEQRRR